MTGAASLADRVREVGGVLGLDAVGFAAAEPTERTRFVADWWARGLGGELDYIGRRLAERADPRRVLPGARTLIVGALLCADPADTTASAGETAGSHPGETPSSRTGETRARLQAGATGPSHGRIARYAGGDDYHDVLLERMRALEAALPLLADVPVSSRAYVDTGPVTERAAAEAAGLGWIGKNSCLIHPELGSHVMLGVILCDLEVEADPPITDHCGTCRACLDACPTDAFPEPYVLDATKCLSYTTIETKGPIPEALRAPQGDHVFGCDVCQTVCPWNRSRPRVQPADPLGLRARLEPRPEWRAPTLAWLLDLDVASFRAAARATAIKRPGLRGLLRNALVAAGNAGDPSLREAIERHAEGEDEMLAEHARWALERLDRAHADASNPSGPAAD